jgi:hypothetical protein
MKWFKVLSMDMFDESSTDRKLLFAAPPVIDAARMGENWFSPALIVGASCQTGRRVSNDTFCRFFDGFGPAQGR